MVRPSRSFLRRSGHELPSSQMSFLVVIIHDHKRARVSKEDAEAGVWDNTSVTSRRRANMNPASKSPKPCQIWETGAAHFIWAGGLVTMGNKVVDPNVMIERIRPEIRLQVRAREHHSERIANHLVGSFTRSILV